MRPTSVPSSSLITLSLLSLVILAGCAGVGGSNGTPAGDVMTVTGPDRGTEGRDFEYIAANDTVRVIIARNNEGPVRTELRPFEEFARWECLNTGLKAIRDRLEDEFGTNPEVGTGHDADAITVTYYSKKLLAPGGEKLRRALPKTVRVTIRFGSRTRTCDVPVTISEGRQPIPG